MQNVPKIVSERLRAVAPVVDHPDADMLTAFAERSLSDRERGSVLEHLACCRDCRDIVALALPASETAQTAIISTRTGWLTWPVLRWGFVTAGIVAVASFGIVHQHQSRPTMVAKEFGNETAANQSQAQSSNAPTAEPSSSSERSSADKISTDKARETANPSPSVLPATPPASAPSQLSKEGPMARSSSPPTPHLPQRGAQAGGPFAGTSAYNYKMQTQWQQKQEQRGPTSRQQNADMAAGLKVPSATQTVEVSGAAPPLATRQSSPLDTEASNVGTLSPSQSSESQPESMFDSTQGLVRAKPAVNVASGAALAIPRWAINNAGVLQRSFDQGTSWQDVNVTANLAPSGTSHIQRAFAVRVEGKKENQQANKDIPAPLASTPTFRAVAATEADVWAGGSNAALYHSLDAGNHWTQVLPSATGVILTGDVVRIEFSDAQHGKVTTSTAEIWLTSDDGLTWQKQ